MNLYPIGKNYLLNPNFLTDTAPFYFDMKRSKLFIKENLLNEKKGIAKSMYTFGVA
jgi:hypothetical protein